MAVVAFLLVLTIISPRESETTATTSSSSASSLDFEMAYRDSFGFFTHVHERDWLVRKSNAKDRVHDSTPVVRSSRAERYKPATWNQLNWDPDFSCGMKDLVGGTEGSNSKWLCDPHRFQQQPPQRDDCLVYNFGTNTRAGDTNNKVSFDFEKDLYRVAPNCEVHVFDPRGSAQDLNAQLRNVNPRASFHSLGIMGSHAVNETLSDTPTFRTSSPSTTQSLKTLPEIMQQLGHTGRRLDVLALDCGGCEWRGGVHLDILQQDVRQLNMELHDYPACANQTMFDIHQAGYVILHKQWEYPQSGGNWVQYAFLKLAPSFFS